MILNPVPQRPLKEKSVDQICSELEKMKGGLERFVDNKDVRIFIEGRYKERIQILKSYKQDHMANPYEMWIVAYNRTNPLKYK